MRLRQVKDRTNRDEAGGIYPRVREVIVLLDVIEVHGPGNSRLLVEVSEITL